MCRIPSGYRSKGIGHCNTSHCCGDHQHWFLLRRCHSLSHTGWEVGWYNNSLAGGLRMGDSGQQQSCTEDPGFDGIVGNAGHVVEGWAGLLYRGWTRFGQGGRRCVETYEGGKGGEDGLSASPRNATVIYMVVI